MNLDNKGYSWSNQFNNSDNEKNVSNIIYFIKTIFGGSSLPKRIFSEAHNKKVSHEAHPMHSSVICYCICPQQNRIYLFYMEKKWCW